jgi:hypothetical protein
MSRTITRPGQDIPLAEHVGTPAADLLAPDRALSSLVVENEKFARFLHFVHDALVERVLSVAQAQHIIIAYGIPSEEAPP